MKIDSHLLMELISYNEHTGAFKWKARDKKWFKCKFDADCWNGRYANKTAGSAYTKKGHSHELSYINIKIFDKSYSAHRLAWLYFYGEMPKHEIDHIDGDGLNNKISNLRDVTTRENQKNSHKHRSNTVKYSKNTSYVSENLSDFEALNHT